MGGRQVSKNWLIFFDLSALGILYLNIKMRCTCLHDLYNVNLIVTLIKAHVCLSFTSWACTIILSGQLFFSLNNGSAKSLTPIKLSFISSEVS